MQPSTTHVGRSIIAGERALAAYAWEDALAHFERALPAIEGREADAETAAIWSGIGRAQVAMGPRGEALPSLTRALDYFVQAADAGGAVDVAACPLLFLGYGVPGVSQFRRRALDLVSQDSVQAARVLAEHGLSLYWETGDHSVAREALGRALAIARREKDTALELRALGHAAMTDLWELRLQESLDSALRAVELSDVIDDPYSEFIAHFVATEGLRVSGDVRGARTHAAAALEAAQTWRVAGRVNLGFVINQMVAQVEGDWQKAREFSDRIQGTTPMASRYLVSRVLLEFEVGSFSEGQSYLDRTLEALGPVGPGQHYGPVLVEPTVPLVARITGDTSGLDTVRAALESGMYASNAVRAFALGPRVGLALIAVERGDSAAAREHYKALVSLRGIIPISYMSADRLLGLLAHTMGDITHATSHFEDAISFCRKANYRPELAWSLCDYADLLRERHAEGDRERAMALLDESLAISRELGMRPLMERSLARREVLTA